MERQRLKWWELIILLLGLLLFAGQAFFSSPQKSASFDEEYHVAAGYAYLKTSDFRMSQDHPPLINALSAIPLLFRQDVQLPVESAAWQQTDFFNFARLFLWESQEDPHAILVWARWSTIILGTMLVVVLFWWARQMAGVWAGWIALILAAFDPNLIANARLVTTDLGVTCFMLLTMWRLWHWRQWPSRAYALLTGLCAGLTMTAKYTGLMVWPMVLAVIFLWKWDDWRGGDNDGKHMLRSVISSVILMGLAAFMVVWAVYRFDLSPFPGTNIPFPASFYPYRVWQTFRVIEDEPLASFLLGQVSRGGWWYYFPVTMAVKTSLPLLILGVVGLWTAVKVEGWRKSAILWLPPLFYLLLAMAGNITIGYRHILPVVPFLIMLSAQVGRPMVSSRRLDDTQINRRSPLPKLLLAGLLLWQIVGTLRLFPHQEAFFNELAGGPAGGGRVLADSNLDWGQDLIALRELMVRMGIDEVNLAYFGTAVPEQYGVHYQPMPGFLRFTAGAEINTYNPYTPPPGWYAIGQTPLHLGLMLQNNDIYAYFQELPPQARAGYSINLYRVEYPAEMPVDRVVITGTAVSDLSPQELGVVDGRRLITKWTANEATTIIPFTEPFSPPDNFQPVYANLAEVMTLAGYTVSAPTASPGEPVELTLFWRRGPASIPTPAPTKGAPLAAFVHLSGTDPAQIVAQYDGWDTAVATLEPGDVIIQHITLVPAPDTPPGAYFLRVGLYSPQSGQRFPLVDDTADFVLLTSLPLR